MALVSYNWTSASLGLAIASVILVLIRRDYLHTRFATWWLLTAAGVFILGTFPRLIDAIGSQMGVSYPPILLVVAGIGMILIKILTMDLERSKQEQELRRVAQRIAFLEGMREAAPEDKLKVDLD